MSRIPASAWIATEKARRTCIPDEKFLSFWSAKRDDLGKGDDVVDLRLKLLARQPEHRAVQEDVLAGGQLRVEAHAELEER